MPTNEGVDFWQAIWFAVLQGVTELFPISSLGHAVVVPHLLGWNLNEDAPSFLPFLVLLHLGTALALLLYFWRDWWDLLASLRPAAPPVEPAVQEQRRLLLLLVLGTVPAGLLGLLLRQSLATLFGRYELVALCLILNGLLLVLGEWLRRRAKQQTLATLRPLQAVAIGASQALALIPGFSRSGATFVGGLLVGLSHEAAARFGFLLATPIILAAAVLEVPRLLRPELRPQLGPALVGGLVAGIVAYLSTAFLMRYFRHQESNALVPFGLYCALLGGFALLLR